MTARSILLQILHWTEGGSSLPIDDAARAQIIQSDSHRDWWTRIELAAHPFSSPKSPNTALLVGDADTADVYNPQEIATFVEGNASQHQFDRFDRECFANLTLLREVISVFRDVHLPTTDTVNGVHTVGDGFAALTAAAPTSITGSVDPAEVQIDCDVAVSPAHLEQHYRSTDSRPGTWIAAGIAASILLAVTFWSIWPAANDTHRQVVDVPNKRDAENSQDNNKEQAVQRTEPSENVPVSRPFEPLTPQIEIVQAPPAPPAIENGDPDTVDPLNPPPETAVSVADAATDQTNPPREVELNWETKAGLLLANVEQSANWQSVHGKVYGHARQRFATAPESWAATPLPSGGTLVLPSDSEISITATGENRDSPTVEVRLIHGRFGIRNLPKESPLVIRSGASQWSVQADGAAATFTVDQHGDGPFLAARSGEVVTDGMPLRAGTQAQLTRSGPASITAESSPAAWLARPEEAPQVPKSVLAQLGMATDLNSDLLNLYEHPSANVRAMAARWRVSLYAVPAAWHALNHRDPTVREAAITAIVNVRRHDPRWRRLWQAVDRDSRNALLAQEIRTWFESAHVKAPLRRAVAMQMIRGLSHNRVAVRQVAIHFLRRHTGRRFGYDPSKPPQSQRRAINAWQTFVTRRFAAATDQRGASAVRPNALNNANSP